MDQSLNLQQVFIKLRQLPVSVQLQVLEYVEFILAKHQTTTESPTEFRFDWAGSLEGEQKSSVELQHEASDLR